MIRALGIALVSTLLGCSGPAPSGSTSLEQPTGLLQEDGGPVVRVIPDAGPAVSDTESSCRMATLEVGTGLLGYRASGQECAGLRHGDWTFRYTDGRAHREGKYLDGAETGPWTFWFYNGQIRSKGSFERGQRVGLWIRNHDNGIRSLEGSYQGGLRDGRWRRWHNTGQLYEDRYYKEGGREGLHRRWNVAGQLRYVRDCKNDSCRVRCKARGKKGCPDTGN